MKKVFTEYSDKNPYKDVKEMSMLSWMIKNEGKRMLFSILFLSLFSIFPWIGQWYIENDLLRWSITIIGLLLNFTSTFLHPWSIWRRCNKDGDRWENNYRNGMYPNL